MVFIIMNVKGDQSVWLSVFLPLHGYWHKVDGKFNFNQHRGFTNILLSSKKGTRELKIISRI